MDTEDVATFEFPIKAYKSKNKGSNYYLTYKNYGISHYCNYFFIENLFKLFMDKKIIYDLIEYQNNEIINIINKTNIFEVKTREEINNFEMMSKYLIQYFYYIEKKEENITNAIKIRRSKM